MRIGLSLAASKECPELFTEQCPLGEKRKHQKFYTDPYEKANAGAGILLSMLYLKSSRSTFQQEGWLTHS